MQHTLLTGATGLLGQYLLRDLLLSGCQVVVLVRASRRASARQRIENILARWDQEYTQTLPRPVVLEGDITQAMCGLGLEEIYWLRENCSRVIHSAASLAFVEEPKTGEPWRSNVDGIANVLGLCQELQNPHLVQVSTAYVCGRTSGVFYENQLDEGQVFSNPYEASKAEAERRVRTATGISGYTILRPSIITGDSRTGYAATYHGFYSPLRVLQAIMSHTTPEDMSAVDFLSAISLQGNERKNFVPVDWVSDAAIKILARQTTVNKTYALVSRDPIRVVELKDAFADGIGEHLSKTSFEAKRSQAGSHGIDLKLIEEQFREQFKVYESYWRDDCDFDQTNAAGLLADTPCPVFDRDLILRLCTVALQANFGFPPSPNSEVKFWAEDWVRGLEEFPAARSTSLEFTLRCLGAGGGEWAILSDGNHITMRPGESRSDNRVTLATSSLLQVANSAATLANLTDQGRVMATGPSSSDCLLLLQQNINMLVSV